MPYAVTPLPFKPHRMRGLSDRLLLSHYENNYGGAVRRLNAIEAERAAFDWATTPGFRINGLAREALIAANSMILHEVHFDALSEEPEAGPDGALAAALERDFGSVDRWRREITAMAKAQAGGSGWTVLSWSPRLGRLVNGWAADHTHALADGAPIFAIDMYEHAYQMDFGARAADYVDTLMRNLSWTRIAARWQRAVAQAAAPDAAPRDGKGHPMLTVDALKARLDAGQPVALVDVCLREDVHRKSDLLPGAAWRDPQQVGDWVDTLPRGVPVVAYCLYGFQVSQIAAARLRERGIDAVALAGGIASWRASGHATVPAPTPDA